MLVAFKLILGRACVIYNLAKIMSDKKMDEFYYQAELFISIFLIK